MPIFHAFGYSARKYVTVDIAAVIGPVFMIIFYIYYLTYLSLALNIPG